MNRQLIIRLLLSCFACFMLFRCESKNEEDLFGEEFCDTSQVSYSGTIEPILRKNCYECHAIDVALQGVIVEGYENLILRVNTGQFEGVVNHLPGYPQMPRNRGKLPECELKQINKWLDEGAPNN